MKMRGVITSQVIVNSVQLTKLIIKPEHRGLGEPTVQLH